MTPVPFLRLSNNATLRNYGTIDITGDGAMTTGTGNGRLFNHDTIRKSGGEGTFVIPASIYIENRAGGFDVQSGTVEVGYWLHVNLDMTMTKTGAGRLDLAGGIGVSGSAVLEEGTLVAGGAPYTGLSVGAGGVFTLSGGTLESNWTSVSGTFLQTGGVHDANGSFTTINVTGDEALYRIVGGEFYADNLSIGIGGEGGRMEQAGGIVSAVNVALVDGRWDNQSSEAVYALEAGTLNVSGTIWVGGATAGSGLFEQWGGDVSAGSVLIGVYGATGTWIMHDGLLTAGVLTVDGVNGEFVQEGGTVGGVGVRRDA